MTDCGQCRFGILDITVSVGFPRATCSRLGLCCRTIEEPRLMGRKTLIVGQIRVVRKMRPLLGMGSEWPVF
jgi:hypothetical protein